MDLDPDTLWCSNPIDIGEVRIAFENDEPFQTRFEQKDLGDTA